MKRIAKRLILPLIAIVLVLALVLSGCSSNSAYVTSIAKTGSNGSQDIYTIYYSDGSTDSFTIENGVNGEDGKDVSIMDIYQTYKEQTGDSEGTGLSVTQGIISTESEYITLQIDDTARSYRSVRIDTALYSGNSGGGLFNKKGELIGITNAGDSSDQNINYAVSLEIVRGTADSIIYYANDGNTETDGVSRLLLGVTVTTQNSKYVYDPSSGCGKISEEVVIASVSEDSIAQTLGLLEGDILSAVIINGTQYEIDRSFEIENLSLAVRANDLVQIVYTRNGESLTTQQYTVSYSDLSRV